MAEHPVSARPMPVRDDINRHYWDGAQREQLVLLRCAQCASYVHPPQRPCPRCRHEALEPTVVSGRGNVYSWSVMHTPGNPGFDERLPYAVVVVELEEQAHLITIGNLFDGDPSELTIGAPVEVCFEKVSDDVTLPQWRLVR